MVCEGCTDGQTDGKSDISGWPAIFAMKIQEQFKNISLLFQNISDVENIITIDLKVLLKKLNLIITKDKSHKTTNINKNKITKVLAS